MSMPLVVSSVVFDVPVGYRLFEEHCGRATFSTGESVRFRGDIESGVVVDENTGFYREGDIEGLDAQRFHQDICKHICEDFSSFSDYRIEPPSVRTIDYFPHLHT